MADMREYYHENARVEVLLITGAQATAKKSRFSARKARFPRPGRHLPVQRQARLSDFLNQYLSGGQYL